jgi:hypothetical protein
VIAGRTTAELIKAFDVHVGTPTDVIASLETDTALSRVTDLVFQVHFVDPPHPYILRSLELIATEVAPALGWARQAASRTTDLLVQPVSFAAHGQQHLSSFGPSKVPAKPQVSA